ncbi:protein of unknown function [Tenacibaculum sp. 190130A14a]|uniref:DUF1642 domain-containing protein n=1 Tax=Tenacibaculum polynesiense TaxID=3137857 RepID=A0ABM9PEK1_9FLAO
MNYEEKQNKLNLEAKEFLTNNLFKKKEEILTEKIIDFFKEKAQLLIENHKILKVINFEFDSIMDFMYSVYPDPYIIPQKYWKDQFIIECDNEDDYKVLQNLCEEFKLEEWDDAYVLIEDEDYYVDIYEILNELHYLYFENSWKKAKSITGVNYRGFLFWHDSYNGVDLDTGLEVRDKDVIDILKKEKFDFTMLEE